MRSPREFRFLIVAAALFVVGSCTEDTPLKPGGPGGNDTIPPPNPTDTIPPSKINGLSVSYSNDAAVFEWIAPHDNEPDDTVATYEIRYSYVAAGNPVAFWDLANAVISPPKPTTPGLQQQYTFTDPPRAKTLWVGIRCYDAEGNRSPNSDLVSVHIPGVNFTGRCVDTFTGDPIEGLEVLVIPGLQTSGFTDANGEFALSDISPGVISVEIKEGNAPTSYHTLKQAVLVPTDTDHTFAMIPVQQTTSPVLQGISVLALLKRLREDLNGSTLLTKWHQYPIPVYIPPFTNINGVDYEALSKAALQRWMDRSGLPVWELVDAPPDTGIVVRYRTPEDISPLIAVTQHEYDAGGYPIHDEIHIVNNADADDGNFIYRVMMHEFGHTIELGHLTNAAFIMFYSHPLPQDISDDEVAVFKLCQALPKRIELSIYDEAYP